MAVLVTKHATQDTVTPSEPLVAITASLHSQCA